jgi:hypothetical protein
VDVHAEDQLATGDVLELVDERAVAVARGDALALEQAERVGSRRATRNPVSPATWTTARRRRSWLDLEVRQTGRDSRPTA